MASGLQIEDHQRYLCFHVSEARNWWRMLLSLLVGAVVLLFTLHHKSILKLPMLFVVGLVVLSLVREIGFHLRGTQVSLTATNLEFTSTGYSPIGYRPSGIPRADIIDLEFRRASGGGDTAASPMGLYIEHRAGLWDRSECVLPQIDEKQAEDVMTAIYHRFPDTGKLASADPLKTGMVVLNLSPTK